MLRGPAVRSLVESGAVQLSLFDQTDLSSEATPTRAPHGVPQSAWRRSGRASGKSCSGPPRLLLDPIVAAARREKIEGRGQDRRAGGQGRRQIEGKMAKHFDLDSSFGYRRKPESIAAEAALSIRTRLDAEGARCAPTSALSSAPSEA